MIKPEEVRIGNLLFDRDNQLCKVKGVTEKEIDAPVINWPITGLPHKPIPLSEEWLIKLGFQKEEDGSVSAQFHFGENPVTRDYLISLIWIKDYKSSKNDLEGFPFYKNGHFLIKSVHQLQNLFFSLTGEELTVKQ